MKKLIALVAAGGMLLGAQLAQACSVCFYGDPTQQVNVALRWAIIALLLVLVLVLSLFAKFFITIGQRSKCELARKY